MADPSVRLRTVIDRGVATALIGAVAMVACGGQEPERDEQPSPPSATAQADTADIGRVAAATGRLVLRWRMTGGIAGFGGPGTLPEFSLYGDGRAVTTPRTRAGSGAMAEQREYRLRPEALRRLLREARAAGLDRSRTAGDELIPDAMSLEIAMGASRTRVVQPERHAGDRAVAFWKRRLHPAGWAPGDQAVPERRYEPVRPAVLAGESPPAAGQRVSDWPARRPLGRGVHAAGGICTVLTGADRDTAIRHVAKAGPGHRWRSGGKVYSVRLRPMLPDERTCRDVAKS
jgi:hypothetical protein